MKLKENKNNFPFISVILSIRYSAKKLQRARIWFLHFIIKFLIIKSFSVHDKNRGFQNHNDDFITSIKTNEKFFTRKKK